MKFPGLSETDGWVSMRLLSSKKKLTRNIFDLQLMVQIEFCTTAFFYDFVFLN